MSSTVMTILKKNLVTLLEYPCSPHGTATYEE